MKKVAINTHLPHDPVLRVPNLRIDTAEGDMAHVEIADIQDKLVWTGNVATNETVSLEREFETGLYFVHATVKEERAHSLMLVKY